MRLLVSIKLTPTTAPSLVCGTMCITGLGMLKQKKCAIHPKQLMITFLAYNITIIIALAIFITGLLITLILIIFLAVRRRKLGMSPGI